jgi:hypothetical protein
MNARVNRQGLGRDIPAHVRREVRRRSKFGCVICRDGFCIYEHLDDFVGVEVHDPSRICLLCESCHGRITRKQWSKDRARLAYEHVQAQSREEAGEPRGPLDFHAGQAELAIGDLLYAPAVASVLRYFGEDLIRLTPGRLASRGRSRPYLPIRKGPPSLNWTRMRGSARSTPGTLRLKGSGSLYGSNWV